MSADTHSTEPSRPSRIPTTETAPDKKKRVANWIWGVVLILIVLIVAAAWWGLRQQADSAADQRVKDVLAQYEATEVTSKVSGGNATISGTLPAGVSAEQLRGAINEVDGVTSVVTNLSHTPVAPSTPLAAVEQPELIAPAEAGELKIVATSQQVQLMGMVPDDQTKQAIIESAATTYQTAHLNEQLTVASPDGEDPSTTGRLGNIPALLEAMGTDSAVSVELNQSTLTISGTVAAEPQRTQAETVAQRVVGQQGTVVNELVVGQATPHSVSAVQLQLNRLPQISFAVRQTTVTDEAKQILDQAAEIIKNSPSITTIIVESHTHDEADATINSANLTQQRAEAAVDYLTSQGIDKQWLKAVGAGALRPIVPNSDPNHGPINRRLQFEVR